MTTERETDDARGLIESGSGEPETSEDAPSTDELTLAPDWGTSEGPPQSGPNFNWRHLIGGLLLALLMLLGGLAAWDLFG
jgi:hypothetical protein